ncbi:MAG: integrase, partial [Geminicoccaceae bacterium]|nr:integrase [Geminicoccaceae bacterium]
GHIRQRGSSWELRLDLPRDPVTGARRTRTETVRGSKRDAQRRLRELLSAVDQGVVADAGKMTVGQWLARWLSEAVHGVSPKTHERYAEIVRKHLVPALGAIPLAKLAPAQVQVYYAAALAGGRRDGRGGLAPQTVRHHDRVLNVALKRARSLRLITINPIEDVARPQVERQELEVLDAEESSRLLAAAATTRLHAPIVLALATGMRRGELLALRWSDVDLPGASLRVVQSLEQTVTGLRFKSPKTKRSQRAIALPQTAVEVLREHRVRQLEERLLLGLGKDDRALVFAQLTGEPFNPRNFSKEFARVVRRAGVRSVTFHGLRHTHITALLQAGVHPKVASERAGHSSITVTMDRYSHVVEGMQADAARRIDSALRQALGSNRVANQCPEPATG